MAPCFLFSRIIKDTRQHILWISNLTLPSNATWVSFTLLSLSSHLMLLGRESKANSFPFPHVSQLCLLLDFCVLSQLSQLPAYVLSSLLFYFSLLNLSLISHQASFSSLTFWCCCFSPSTISLTYGWRPKVHQIKWQKHQKCPSQPEVTRAACCHIVVIGSKRIQVFWIYEWY